MHRRIHKERISEEQQPLAVQSNTRTRPSFGVSANHMSEGV